MRTGHKPARRLQRPHASRGAAGDVHGAVHAGAAYGAALWDLLPRAFQRNLQMARWTEPWQQRVQRKELRRIRRHAGTTFGMHLGYAKQYKLHGIQLHLRRYWEKCATVFWDRHTE